MNVVHEKVNHKVFGLGTITKQTQAVIEVKFGKENGTKKFVYPAAFEMFLELNDTVSQGKMKDELRQIKEQAENDNKERKNAEQKVLDDARLALSEKKRATLKKRTAEKSAAKKATKKSKEQAEAEKETEEVEDNS